MFINSTKRQAFTLIELLVVIAIIAILAAILFPVFSRARENARRTSCLSNLRQVGLGFMQYVQDNDEQFPFNKTDLTTGKQSWVVSAQPYLKSTQVLRCPSDTSENWNALLNPPGTGDFAGLRITSYVENLFYVPAAPTAANPNPAPKPFANLAATQKPANVILLTESGKNWTAGYFHASAWPAYPGGTGAHWITATSLPEDVNTTQHMEGFNCAYVDGHAKWHRWSQVWWQDLNVTPNVTKGSFDPNQS
ncbi:hypothetical protein IAD21_04901 [Abditibacteriota bacterium]|nr:hypothetical protein IAD21_04901 [Abditibacteriota bacterium]